MTNTRTMIGIRTTKMMAKVKSKESWSPWKGRKGLLKKGSKIGHIKTLKKIHQ